MDIGRGLVLIIGLVSCIVGFNMGNNPEIVNMVFSVLEPIKQLILN